MKANLAIDAARALASNPALIKPMRGRPLPPGVSGLLRRLSEGAHDEDERRLIDDLEFYVQNIMLYPGAPPRRVLGVVSDAPREKMREHMRLLLLWLHPDRSSHEWRSVFAARVIEAWRTASVTPPEASHPARRSARSGRVRLTWVRHPTSPGPSKRRRIVALVLLAAIAAGGGAAILIQPPIWDTTPAAPEAPQH